MLPSLLLLGALTARADVVLVPSGATWRFHDDGVAPPSTWTTAAFDDSAWSSGPARLGYGDPEIVTPVSPVSSPSVKGTRPTDTTTRSVSMVSPSP